MREPCALLPVWWRGEIFTLWPLRGFWESSGIELSIGALRRTPGSVTGSQLVSGSLHRVK